MNNKLWISIGENCFAQTTWAKLKLNTQNTIYSYAFSNIKYVLHFEEHCYQQLLDPNNIIIDHKLGITEAVVPNKYESELYLDSFNHYPDSTRSFVLWHNDVTNIPKEKEKFIRRINRMKDLKDRGDVVLTYYYSRTDKDEIGSVKEDLLRLQKEYYPKAKILFLYHSQSPTDGAMLKLVSQMNGMLEVDIQLPEQNPRWEDPERKYIEVYRKLFDQAAELLK